MSDPHLDSVIFHVTFDLKKLNFLLPLYKLGRTERSFHHRSRPFSLLSKSLLKTRTNLNLEKMAFTTSEITIDDSLWRRKTHTVSHP